MKFLPYLLKHLRRNWIRTLSTVSAMAVCIFLFCVLQTVIRSVSISLQSANASRLVVRHAVSLAFNVPLSYKERIAGIPGVKRVATVTWFGGSLPAKKEEKKDGAASGSAEGPNFSTFFTNFGVDGEAYFAIHPEYEVKPDEMREFLQDLRGCVIGRALAKQFGWKVGDTFFLESFIPPYRRREGPFEFVVRGIADVDLQKHPGTETRIMFFNHKYLYEGTGRRVGAGTYAVEIEDPAKAGEISKAVDALFENSDAQTKTETEAAFAASFVSLAGNLAFLLNSIGLAVIFTILLVTANTMSMAVRERRTEIAVLKTLGFPSALVLSLILGEALLIAALGGGLGLLLSGGLIAIIPKIPAVGSFLAAFPSFELSPATAGIGFGVSMVLGLFAGFVPAMLAYKARITDMLRQV